MIVLIKKVFILKINIYYYTVHSAFLLEKNKML